MAGSARTGGGSVGTRPVDCSGVTVGGGSFVLIAGPCAVEDEARTLRIAKAVKAAGASMLRGGAFKPRTDPESFQGLGAEGIRILLAAKRETGLPIVTELMDARDLPLFNDVDVIQIGARNMQNFALLKEIGTVTRKPVLLKRGLAATVRETVAAARYIVQAGNPNVMLCERGIRTFETATRFTADPAALAVMRELADFPVLFDPSHPAGRTALVSPLACAATAAGADGLIVEVHDAPAEARCDGAQALTPASFAALVQRLRRIRAAVED